jgi:3',5'-nucleoside bisphosphate phosphatase
MRDELYGDLHIHTFYSDGTERPEEILAKIQGKGIGTVSFTDHDSISVYENYSLPELSRQFGMEIIPGIELSADFTNSRGVQTEVHILSYFFDASDKKLKDYLHHYQQMRYERAKQMISRLNGINIKITMEDLDKKVKSKIYGRLHVANVLTQKGYAGSTQEAFQRFIGYGKPAYVPKAQKTLPELTRLIHGCGGLAFIAHPHLQNITGELELLKTQGIDGTEVFHPEQPPAVRERLLQDAGRLSLLVTGGSDYHGTAKDRSPLGEIKTPAIYIQNMRDAHRAGNA